MRKRLPIALAVLLVVLAGGIAGRALRLWEPIHGESGRSATANAVAMTLVGYTNPPLGRGRFALLSVSNPTPYTVRLRDSWVELEGSPNHWARSVNPGLAACSLPRGLKLGESATVAVGEPTDASETQRWRFAMLFSRYNWRQRWFDFLVQHKLPLTLGRVRLVDFQRIFSPSNSVTVTTGWLAP